MLIHLTPPILIKPVWNAPETHIPGLPGSKRGLIGDRGDPYPGGIAIPLISPLDPPNDPPDPGSIPLSPDPGVGAVRFLARQAIPDERA